MKTRTKKRTLADVDEDVRRLRHAFGMAMAWMSASANAPLRRGEVETILSLAKPRNDQTKGPRA